MEYPLYRGLSAACFAVLLGTAACGQSETTDTNTPEENTEVAANTPDGNNAADDTLNGNDNADNLADANADAMDSTDGLTEPETPQTDEGLNDSMPILEHKDWAAWINLMPGPDVEPSIIVTGQVQLGSAGQTVTLKPMEPQGFNPAILMLEVDIESSMGAQVLTWYGLRYEAPASQGQYTEVSILWNGQIITSIPVTEAH